MLQLHWGEIYVAKIDKGAEQNRNSSIKTYVYDTLLSLKDTNKTLGGSKYAKSN
jgi:hypothetical protein